MKRKKTGTRRRPTGTPPTTGTGVQPVPKDIPTLIWGLIQLDKDLNDYMSRYPIPVKSATGRFRDKLHKDIEQYCSMLVDDVQEHPEAPEAPTSTEDLS